MTVVAVVMVDGRVMVSQSDSGPSPGLPTTMPEPQVTLPRDPIPEW